MYNPFPLAVPRQLLKEIDVSHTEYNSQHKIKDIYNNNKNDKGNNTNDSDISIDVDLDKHNRTKDKKERNSYESKGSNSYGNGRYTDMDTDKNDSDASSVESNYEKKLPNNNESCSSTDANLMFNQQFSLSDELTIDTHINNTTDNFTNDNTLRIKKFVPLSRTSPQLALEITLMNLLTNYKMPMNVLKTIFDWA